MEIRLFNFPADKETVTATLFEEAGHTIIRLRTPDLYEAIDTQYALPPILVYSDMPESEAQSIYDLLYYRYPSGPIWMVSPSYRPEDVRAAFLSSYRNYLLWSSDLGEIKAAAEKLAGSPAAFSGQSREDFRFHAVSYPLEEQLVTDRILTAITDTSSNPYSSYYPLLYRREDLWGCVFVVCILRLHMPLSLYLRQDYAASYGILLNKLRLHMQTIENILSPSFGVLKSVKDSELLCLFYHKGEPGFEKEILHYLNLVNDRIQSYEGVSLLAGYSLPYDQLTETNTHYSRIVTNLNQGYFYPARTVQMLDEDREYISFSKEIDDYIKKNLFIAIANNDCDLIVETLVEACRMFMEQKVMATVAKTLLLYTLVRFAQETDFYLLVSHEFIERFLFTAMMRVVSFPLLEDLFSLIGEVYAKTRKICASDDGNRLVMAMQYIQKNFYRKISLESISNYLALSPNYFCGWFKKTTGENFGDVVIRYRIDAAKSMLTGSPKKICDIAEEVGYAEIVSFNRAFKKQVGMTPDQYRKSHLLGRTGNSVQGVVAK